MTTGTPVKDMGEMIERDKLSLNDRIDLAFGSLKTEQERDLVVKMKAALDSRSGFGFLQNRKEAWGKQREQRAGYRNRSLVNLDEPLSDKLSGMISERFRTPSAGPDAINDGDVQITVVEDLDSALKVSASISRTKPLQLPVARTSFI